MMSQLQRCKQGQLDAMLMAIAGSTTGQAAHPFSYPAQPYETCSETYSWRPKFQEYDADIM